MDWQDTTQYSTAQVEEIASLALAIKDGDEQENDSKVGEILQQNSLDYADAATIAWAIKNQAVQEMELTRLGGVDPETGFGIVTETVFFSALAFISDGTMPEDCVPIAEQVREAMSTVAARKLGEVPVE